MTLMTRYPDGKGSYGWIGWHMGKTWWDRVGRLIRGVPDLSLFRAVYCFGSAICLSISLRKIITAKGCVQGGNRCNL